jgi:hypothetical protein
MVSWISAIVLIAAPALALAQTAPAVESAALPRLEPVRDTVPPAAAAGHDIAGHDIMFTTVSAAFVVAASTDLSVSMYQIGRGSAREVAFGAQWQDSPVAFAVSKSVMTAAFVYGLQRMHKTRPKTALVLGLVATAVEGWLAVRSAQIPPR